MADDRLQHFTDRDTQIAAFDALWQCDSPWAIVFTGVSGNGKSTLIDWLIAHRCKPDKIGHTKIELFGGLNPAYILDRLADLLSADAAGRCRAECDAATQDYHQQSQQLMQAVAARPVTADIVACGQSQISQAEITIQTGQAEAEAQQALRRIYHERLTATMRPELLRPNRDRAVVFLDTYERVQESSPEKEIAWLWDLLAEAHAARPSLRVVVGSRVDVVYPPARDCRRHAPLEEFSQEDSDKFLSAWSRGQILPDLRATIFNLAQGHPLLTEIAAELWRDGQRAGHPLTLAELRSGLEHRSAEEWLYGRIINRLEQLGDTRLVAAARYGPLLRSFTMRSLNALLPEGVGQLDDAAFRRFTGYAFTKDVANGWTFHELMRDVQLAYLERQDDPEVEACHQRAAGFFGERVATTKDPEAARNALYHTCFLDPAAAFDAWNDETFRAQLAGDRQWWDELLQVMERPAQYRRLDQSQQGDLAGRRGMWLVRHYAMDTALASYAQALDLFRAVGDRLGEANVWLALAPFAENPDTVFSIALSLYESIGDRYSQARVHYRMGDRRRDQGNIEGSHRLYSLARDIWLSIGLDNLVEQILAPRLANL